MNIQKKYIDVPMKYTELKFLKKLYLQFFSSKEETCGIINRKGVFKTENIAKNKEMEFRIKNHFFLRKKLPTFGTVHTHTNRWLHEPHPTKEDIEFSRRNRLKLNILIITWKYEFVFFGPNLETRKIKLPIKDRIALIFSLFRKHVWLRS